MAAGLVAILIVCGLGQTSSAAKPVSSSTLTLSGKVVTLASVLKERGVKADSEQTGVEVVLKTVDGAIVPLLRDEASRALFLDKRLRDRKAELTLKARPGLPFAQVIVLKVEENGRLRVPEYFCEICTISVPDPRTCPCCQGSMELRMRPEEGE